MVGSRSIWVFMLLKLAEYNPLSATRPYRLDHIVNELAAVILWMSGTGFKQAFGNRSNWNLEGGYRIFSWGWDGRQQYSNKSAGVAIVLGPRLSDVRVTCISEPPSSLQGRGGKIIIKQHDLDLTLVCSYPQPVTGKGEQCKRAATGAKLAAQWAIAQLNTAKGRSTPLLLGDLQQKFGLTNSEKWPGVGPFFAKERGKLDVDKVWEQFFMKITSAMSVLIFALQVLLILGWTGTAAPLSELLPPSSSFTISLGCVWHGVVGGVYS